MSKIKFLAPNQAYYHDGTKIVFQSYDTVVCTIENWENANEPIVKITSGQPQSTTTAKYLNKFLDLQIGVSNYKTFLKK